jgi:mannose-6-phosphate isomerase-like protein (cupin superfamily)
LDRWKGGDVTRLIIRPDAACHSVAELANSLTVVEGTGRIGEIEAERGSTFSAAAGEALQIENRGREPLVVIQVTLPQDKKR